MNRRRVFAGNHRVVLSAYHPSPRFKKPIYGFSGRLFPSAERGTRYLVETTDSLCSTEHGNRCLQRLHAGEAQS